MATQDSTTIKEALSHFYQKHGLPEDGGMSKTWARYQFGPLTVPVYNTKGRRRALKHHDIHHILTSYEGEFKDETAIGAWEVASGCKDFYHAWLFNLWAFALGLPLFPKQVYRAFIRGRYSQNLYGVSLDQPLLNTSVATLRRQLGIDAPSPVPTFRDKCTFACWALVACLALIMPVVVATGLGGFLVGRIN